ncbi:MAG: DNA mismatch repair endonuclease MutL [Anaerovoracaceae bacterium]
MIKILDKHIADKIAAGEVIDRPVSIIKELLENSIDAGADNITIEIKNGGKSYIRVTDNGCGIEAEDIETAFKRHATSKISSVKDLDAIGTLGFRGEALASICAVSRVELISKTKNSKIGKRIIVEESNVLSSESTGCPDGTTVTVKDLFFNIPARHKFLSSDNGESRRIIDMVSRIALSYGDIKITLINSGSKVFSTNGKGNILNNIVSVYGSDIGRNLLPVEMTRGDFLIKGFVSAPYESAASRSKQIFCVNGRVISSKLLEKSLDTAYKEKLFHGRFPIAFLFLYIPADKLDVNIHPTKKEIRFDDDFEVMDFVTKAVRNALNVKESLPKVRSEDIKSIKSKSAEYKTEPEYSFSAVNEEQNKFDFDLKENHTEYQTVEKEKDSDKENISAQNSLAQESRNFHKDSSQVDIKNILTTMRNEINEDTESNVLRPKPAKTEEFDFTQLNYIGSVFDTYIIASDKDDFYLIDQHAAHERIFYEKLLTQYNSSEKLSQQLLLPLNFNVSAMIEQTEDDWIDNIKNMGYDIEYFGNNTYIVREIPAFMQLAEAESFLNDMFKEIDEKPDLTNKRILDKIIMKSCKSAVKGGDHLTSQEIDGLIKDLKNCVNPFSCPHGRPTFVRMTKYEIEKMFKRV